MRVMIFQFAGHQISESRAGTNDAQKKGARPSLAPSTIFTIDLWQIRRHPVAWGFNSPPSTDFIRTPGVWALLALVVSHLLGQIALIAQFFNLMKLGFQPIHVAFFVLEQLHQQVA